MAFVSVCVAVDVPLDMAEVDRVRSDLVSALSDAVVEARELVLDLTECDFVDAVGHRMLTEVAGTAESRGVVLRLVGVRPAVVRALRVLDAVLGGHVQAGVVVLDREAAPQGSFSHAGPS